jgi:tryptophan-rich sensory protein
MQSSGTGVNEWIGLVVSFVVCFAVAGLGSLATTPNIPTWYATLNKPSWNPPNWLFGPVWTVLYALMAVAVWLVWRRTGWGVAVTIFAIQLALNLAWSFIFFGSHQPGLAFLEIVLLWLAIAATVLMFFQVSTVAAILMIPYLLWVSFAAALNYTIWRLNG